MMAALSRAAGDAGPCRPVRRQRRGEPASTLTYAAPSRRRRYLVSLTVDEGYVHGSSVSERGHHVAEPAVP